MDFPSIVDACAKVGFPIVAAIFLGVTLREVAQWFMRTGDELKARFVKHVDDQDKALSEMKPQLAALTDAAKNPPQVCRFETQAPGTPVLAPQVPR
ncbi:MAG: hypothetical protein KGL39_32765 [Patescibacteria group bacterium]|nr:hypothetical protein [Patescibacteria group bacterium]